MSNRQSVSDIMVFSEQLLAYMRLFIFANKGTDNDDILEACVKTYEKLYRQSMIQDDKDTVQPYWRKVIKRFNLSCRTLDDSPLNLLDKDSQRRIKESHLHQFALSSGPEEMCKYAKNNNIRVLPGIPFEFMIGLDTEYHNLLWQYFRVIVINSEEILGFGTSEINLIGAEASNIILEIENDTGVQKLISSDIFLNVKLYDPQQDPEYVKEEVHAAMRKQNYSEDDPLTKMMDSVTDTMFENDYCDQEFLASAACGPKIIGMIKGIVKDKNNISTFKDTPIDTVEKLLNAYESVQSTSGGNVPSSISQFITLAKSSLANRDTASIEKLKKMSEENGCSQKMLEAMFKN